MRTVDPKAVEPQTVEPEATRPQATAFIAAVVLAAVLSAALLLAGCSPNRVVDRENRSRLGEMYGQNQPVVGEYDEAHAVTCANGTFVGLEEDGVISYKGIPYAEPPVGELRWKDPVPAQADDGVYEAFYFGPSPLQTEWPSELGSYYPQSEDCLFLNVWVNDSNPSTGKPVMVFIHGGSYAWGATSDPLYDGHNLVSRFDDVVLVTVEYRLGMLGFIDFSSVPGGEEYATSGNLGLLDQVCALRWVQDNIASFGGDPANVTVIGESSGGGSVSLLPLMKGTQGLFQRVISESGSVALTFSRDECALMTELLLEETDCSTMEDLLALSEEELVKANSKLSDYNNFAERDGVVLPEDPYAAYAEGATADLDFLAGTNEDEVRYWIAEMGYYTNLASGLTVYKQALPVMFENNLMRLSEEDRQLVDRFMDLQHDKKAWNRSEFYNELLFRVPALKQLELHAANGGRAYNYYFAYPGADETMGACHAMELAYVFNNPDETIYTGGHVDEELARQMQDMWVNFARTGDPSTETVDWEPYSKDRRMTMVLDEDIHMEQDLKEEQRSLVEPLSSYYFNGCYVQLSFNVPYVRRVIGAAVLVLAAAVVLAVHCVRRRAQRRA